MKWYQYILSPLSLPYRAIVMCRKWYFFKHKKRFKSPAITIGVGNLNLGGSGKTPMVDFLVKHLSHKTNLAVLSRGYGRKTKGFLAVEKNASPNQVGDEPKLLSLKNPAIDFFVCESRRAGLQKIVELKPETQAVVLDDVFQHWDITCDFYLLITPFYNPFYRDAPLPSGQLREPRSGAQRAHAIVVSKCPADLSAKNQEKIRLAIRKYSEAPVYFCSIAYQQPQLIFGPESSFHRVVLVTSIAHCQPLVKHLEQEKITLVKHLKFKDHHSFVEADIRRIEKQAKALDAPILCTEKDMVKIIPLMEKLQLSHSIYSLPIAPKFLGQDYSRFSEQMANLLD